MTSSVPVNIPTTKQQSRRPPTFLSLSPVEKPAGPAATIFETLTSRAVIDSHPVSPKTITMLESKIDAGKTITVGSPVFASAESNHGFLKLGHAKPGDSAGDWIE